MHHPFDERETDVAEQTGECGYFGMLPSHQTHNCGYKSQNRQPHKRYKGDEKASPASDRRNKQATSDNSEHHGGDGHHAKDRRFTSLQRAFRRLGTVGRRFSQFCDKGRSALATVGRLFSVLSTTVSAEFHSLMSYAAERISSPMEIGRAHV